MAETIKSGDGRVYRVDIGGNTYLVPEEGLAGVRKGIHDVRETQGKKDDPEAVAKRPLEKLSE